MSVANDPAVCPASLTDPGEVRVRGRVARCLLAILRFYRVGVSPLRPACCRYTPTCSEYAVDSIELHGSWRGTYLAVRRLLRCHPFHAGGHDPVPPRVDTSDAPPAPRYASEPAV